MEVRFHVFVTSVLVGGGIRGFHNGVDENLRLAVRYAVSAVSYRSFEVTTTF